MSKITPFFFTRNASHIIAFSSSTSSTGFFGLPIALVLLQHEAVNVYIVIFIGISLFENTYGFYIATYGIYNTLHCIKKILKLPIIYAIVLGILLKVFALTELTVLHDFLQNMRGSYVTLGMIVMGLSLARVRRFIFNWRHIAVTLIAKYLLWPLMIMSFVYFDKFILHVYNNNVHNALLILAIVPVSIGAILVAATLNYPAAGLSAAVLIHTLLSIVYIPLMVSIFLH